MILLILRYNNEVFDVEIYNLTGLKVFSQKNIFDSVEIKTKDFTEGNCLISVSSGGKRYSKKLLIVHY